MENRFHEMLLKRHSIRRYTDQQLKPDDVHLILEAALLAPTSKSSRGWQLVVVDDPATLASLSECKPTYATSIKDCRMAVVVAMDPSKSDAWIEDGAVAAILMQLQAESLGIGSCWVETRGRSAADGTPSEQVVRELLGLPEGLVPMCIVSFGYSAETRKPVDPSKLKWEQVHIGSYKARE